MGNPKIPHLIDLLRSHQINGEIGISGCAFDNWGRSWCLILFFMFLLGVMDKSVRDCTRVMIDDFEAAKLFFELLKPVAPLCYEGALFDSVNERFRFLKYTPGFYFYKFTINRTKV